MIFGLALASEERPSLKNCVLVDNTVTSCDGVKGTKCYNTTALIVKPNFSNAKKSYFVLNTNILFFKEIVRSNATTANACLKKSPSPVTKTIVFFIKGVRGANTRNCFLRPPTETRLKCSDLYSKKLTCTENRFDFEILQDLRRAFSRFDIREGEMCEPGCLGYLCCKLLKKRVKSKIESFFSNKYVLF